MLKLALLRVALLCFDLFCFVLLIVDLHDKCSHALRCYYNIRCFTLLCVLLCCALLIFAYVCDFLV